MAELDRPKIARNTPTNVAERIEEPPSADHGSLDMIEGEMPADFAPNEDLIGKPSRASAVKKAITWHKVRIALGASTASIRINELEFHHGQIATVDSNLLPVLNEVMYNTRQHDRIVRGDAQPYGSGRFQGALR